ncbi:MAG: hypothetical protein ISS33_00270 [Candidatus Omnitrophica bacterium]|nr:hypothetical protein [Candidatus Omnitrophota bacterium]
MPCPQLTEGSGSFSPTTHPEQSEGSLVNLPKESIEILQPFGLQDEESGNSPTPQLTLECGGYVCYYLTIKNGGKIWKK